MSLKIPKNIEVKFLTRPRLNQEKLCSNVIKELSKLPSLKNSSSEFKREIYVKPYDRVLEFLIKDRDSPSNTNAFACFVAYYNESFKLILSYFSEKPIQSFDYFKEISQENFQKPDFKIN